MFTHLKIFMINAKITGIASFAPEFKLTNDDLSKMVDTNDEWITTRVGIKERRILKEPNAGSSYMGIKAVSKLLAETGTKAEDIDLIICATSTFCFKLYCSICISSNTFNLHI